jgi:hypothetical protein
MSCSMIQQPPFEEDLQRAFGATPWVLARSDLENCKSAAPKPADT